MKLATAFLSSLFLTVAHAQTCGWGHVGDGVCADPFLCCSQWGWCGTSASHCAGSNPVPPPILPQPTMAPAPSADAPGPAPMHEHDTRLIAYLGNWQSCPTMAQVAPYTHIIIAFAVSYTWNPSKNNCSPTCEIAEPPICSNAPNPALVSQWQAAGKKVILSFGGAGMGGSWAGDNNDCWEQCYGRETQVTDRLVEIVNNMGLDGIDLDFEYHVTPTAVNFLNTVTTGLKNKLPAGSEITHAPMDSDVIPGKPYYDDVLMATGHMLDFLMPQYYNGATRPGIDGIDGNGAGAISALSHYTTIVDGIYGGDPTRMVFGFCISDCAGTGSNVNAAQASAVMTGLAATYPCNGGAFFWVAEHDYAASWSTPVSLTMNNLRQCSVPAPTIPTISPPPAPTPNPTTTIVTNAPEPTSSEGDPCCPVGFSGIRAWNDCLQYYFCVSGAVTGPVYDVPAGTLFDTTVGNFVWSDQLEECIFDNCGVRRLRGESSNGSKN